MTALWNRGKSKNNDNVADAAPQQESKHVLRFGGLGFDPLEEKATIPAIERLAMGGIPGGDANDLACAKPSHSEPRAINEVLADTMEHIISKASDGTFDHQAVPIIEAWVGEIAGLAQLQSRKEGLRAQTVMRAKQAADAAIKAVSDERQGRERAIRSRCKTV